MSTLSPPIGGQILSDHMRGVIVCGLIGGFAIFGSQLYQAPVMLAAIILGLTVHFLSAIKELQSGINWCAKNLLYIGVALLGLRIDIADLTHAGLPVLSLILFTLVATISIGYVVSRSLGQTKGFSFIIGGSVAICGVSAAAALCASMEECKTRDQELAITVAGITVLSTLVMLFYPVISQAIGLNDMAAGTLMGGSIHNVSQAVGAGLAVSEHAGDIAVLTKLLRVSMLLPIVFIIAVLAGRRSASAEKSAAEKIKAYFPPFLVVFFILATLSCMHVVPAQVTSIGSELATVALVVSLVAIGIKTDLKEVASVGVKPLIAMGITTVAMAAIVLAGIYILSI